MPPQPRGLEGLRELKCLAVKRAPCLLTFPVLLWLLHRGTPSREGTDHEHFSKTFDCRGMAIVARTLSRHLRLQHPTGKPWPRGPGLSSGPTAYK